jgi:hypothetical protein
MIGKKGQMTIFVIIAIVLVAGIVTFYALRGQIFVTQIPADLQPVFDYYASCIKDEAQAAISLAGSQGGHVDPGVYIPGSNYAPFSSQLNFLGSPVPYWFYISGNGVVKENVPSKSQIADGISSYIEGRVNADCNLDDFYAKGFSINFTTPVIKTTIQDTNVIADVGYNLVVSKGDSSARKTSESVEVASNFGKMYNAAIGIYDKEKNEAFLENYSVDVLRAYAPVDGVEISCSGKIWKTRDVVNDLKDGLVANIGAIKFKGDYYTLNRASEKYFVVNLPFDGAVNLIYSKDWPTRVSIEGANELMIASPVGTQAGMGAMGFCYAPYHFVYDLSFPVLIQLFEGNELFQFPVVVIVDKSMPRTGLASDIPLAPETTDICQYNTQDLQVNVYDVNLNKVDANISLLCMTDRCELGETVGGTFVGKAPACMNGYLDVNAAGYVDKTQLISTNEESSADVILDREYDVDVGLEVGGKPLEGNAIVSFVGGDSATSTVLPDVSKIKLSEGLYNVSVMVYANSSLTIPASTRRQCTTVARTGIAGLFGSTEEKCFDINMPETKIESALVGGGQGEIYLLPSDLEDGKITLEVDALPAPKSLDDLSKNFESFDDMGVDLKL